MVIPGVNLLSLSGFTTFCLKGKHEHLNHFLPYPAHSASRSDWSGSLPPTERDLFGLRPCQSRGSQMPWPACLLSVDVELRVDEAHTSRQGPPSFSWAPMETEQVQIDSHDGSSASTERTISINYKSCYSLHQAVLLSMISLKNA